jgi:beta-phosphoglucomutase
MIKAVLMDLDGTLCDCTEVHYISLNKALSVVSGFEISREDHIKIFNGIPTNKKLDLLIADCKIKENDRKAIWELKQSYTKEAIIQLLKYDDNKVILHKYLKSKDIKLACITNSILETASLMLKTTGQFEYMDLLIANDMIRYPKPHPEGFIRAMIYFQVMPENVLIIEDSPVGIQAAKASGANVWEVKGVDDVILENIMEHLCLI